MPDVNITTNISRIRSAVYGRDVRTAIADSIAQCYSDTSTGATLAHVAAEEADQATGRANDAASAAEIATGNANDAASAAISAAESLANIALSAIEYSTASPQDTIDYVINGQTGGDLNG